MFVRRHHDRHRIVPFSIGYCIRRGSGSFLSRGLDHAAIHQNTFDEQSLNRVQLQGFAMVTAARVGERTGHRWLERGDLDRFQYESVIPN